MKIGQTMELNCQLFDGATNKFVKAFLFNSAGTQYDSVDLTSLGLGLYRDSSKIFNDPTEVTVTFIVYSDSGYSVIDTDYTYAYDSFKATVSNTNGLGITGTVTTDINISCASVYAPNC